MKKNRENRRLCSSLGVGLGTSQKIFRMVKSTVLLFFLGLLQVVATESYSQITRLSLEASNEPVEQVLSKIEDASQFFFLYNRDLVDVERKVTLSVENETIGEILDNLFDGTDVAYSVKNRQIILSNLKESSVAVQQRIIKGKVVDKDGISLPGVTVLVKGTTNGTVTNLDGEYSISGVASGDVIVFSFVGMRAQEIAVTNQAAIDITLEPDAIGIEEVIAVGYGTQRKRDLTGAITSVSADDLESRNVTNVSNALQGAVAGVMVTRSSSAPGAGNTIRIRGITTLEGTSDPLILVDDVPVASMNDVNPEDIASYSVLKDGAAAAIYGSRAAAGVIIIKTKRAKEGYFAIDYSGSYSINKPTKMIDLVGPTRYMEMWNEKIWNDSGNGEDQYPVFSKEHIENYMSNHAQDPNNYPITDWKELLVKESAFTNRHNVSITGGSKKIKSKASFGYEHQDGLYEIKDWKRYTLRINNDITVNDKWGGNVDVSYRMTDNVDPFFYPLGDEAQRQVPFYGALYADGRYGPGRDGGNIYAQLHLGGDKKSRSQAIQAKLGMYFKPFEGMTLRANFSPSYRNYYNKSFQKSALLYGPDDHDNAGPALGYFYQMNKTNLYENRNVSESRTTQLSGNYNKKIGEHSISADAIYEEYYSKYENLAVKGLELPMTDFPYLTHVPDDKVFANPGNGGIAVSESAYRSMIGRINYGYKNKYLLQAVLRRDGSSKFASEYRWGTFPSVSLGWVITEEDFAQGLKEKVSFMKLRGSYGSLGNDRLGNYLYISELVLASELFQNTNGSVSSERTAALQYLVMRDITWETTHSANIGLDFTTCNDRLSISMDAYQKKTVDMLLNLSVPSVIGFDNPKTNVGEMTTKGWEFQSTWRDKVGQLGYTVAFNISNSQSIVGDINGKQIYSGATITEEGEEFRTLYGYKTDGLFQSQEDVDNSPVVNSNVKPGDIKFLDISGPDGEPDGIINAHDRTHLGGSLPKFIFGGNLKFDYKGFDLGFVFQGIGKQNRVVDTRAVDGFTGNFQTPTVLYDGNYWSQYNTPEENLNVDYPRLSAKSQGINKRFSEYWVFNGAYFRVKNVTLGYTLPKTLTDKVGINKLRLYVAGNDLFSIDKFPAGMDPEFALDNYFITKSYIFGVKLNF